jgi:hypothetical protein
LAARAAPGANCPSPDHYQISGHARNLGRGFSCGKAASVNTLKSSGRSLRHSSTSRRAITLGMRSAYWGPSGIGNRFSVRPLRSSPVCVITGWWSRCSITMGGRRHPLRAIAHVYPWCFESLSGRNRAARAACRGAGAPEIAGCSGRCNHGRGAPFLKGAAVAEAHELLMEASAGTAWNQDPARVSISGAPECVPTPYVPVPTVNPKQLSIACESVDDRGDGRSPQVDLVRRGSGCSGRAQPCKPKFSPFGISSMC